MKLLTSRVLRLEEEMAKQKKTSVIMVGQTNATKEEL